MQSLAEARAGESCTIKWMFGSPRVLDFLRKYEIKEGSLIHVLQRGKTDMIIGAGDLRFAIGNDVAERIKV